MNLTADQPPSIANEAHEAQAEFFKFLYQEQSERRKNLQERSKFYFTIVSFYLGAIYFKFQDIVNDSKPPVALFWSSLASATFLTVALIFALLATRVRAYATLCDPSDYFEKLGSKSPELQAFYDGRTLNYAAAVIKNRKVNDAASKNLGIAGWLIVAAACVQLCGLIFARLWS